MDREGPLAQPHEAAVLEGPMNRPPCFGVPDGEVCPCGYEWVHQWFHFVYALVSTTGLHPTYRSHQISLPFRKRIIPFQAWDSHRVQYSLRGENFQARDKKRRWYLRDPVLHRCEFLFPGSRNARRFPTQQRELVFYLTHKVVVFLIRWRRWEDLRKLKRAKSSAGTDDFTKRRWKARRNNRVLLKKSHFSILPPALLASGPSMTGPGNT